MGDRFWDDLKMGRKEILKNISGFCWSVLRWHAAIALYLNVALLVALSLRGILSVVATVSALSAQSGCGCGGVLLSPTNII